MTVILSMRRQKGPEVIEMSKSPMRRRIVAAVLGVVALVGIAPAAVSTAQAGHSSTVNHLGPPTGPWCC